MNIDTLRTLINDVDPDNQIFTDDQLEDFLELEGNLYSAAAAACQALAAQYALKKKVNVRGISVENQQIYEHYMDLAKQYTLWANDGRGDIVDEGGSGSGSKAMSLRPVVTGVTISGIKTANLDIDRVPDVFPKPISDIGNGRRRNWNGTEGC